MSFLINIICDYRGSFGSKYDSIPYRSGLDKKLLKDYLSKLKFDTRFLFYPEIDFYNLNKNDFFWHDSIEDIDNHYKTYMEDVIYALELKGFNVIPGHKYIKAHNNKVFMEFLRKLSGNNEINNLNSKHFGCYEEFIEGSSEFIYPAVIKGAEDAQSRKVRLGKNDVSARKFIKEISRTPSYLKEFKEKMREKKYPGYKKESKYRNKFIVQEFLPYLINDWKILIFGDRLYILRRGVPEGDFRASGSHYQYGFGSQSTPPDGIFDYAYTLYEDFNVPYISIDVVFDGVKFYAIEFQFVSFGSSTHLYSDCYFKKNGEIWEPVYEKHDLEYLYVDSISQYIRRNYPNSK